MLLSGCWAVSVTPAVWHPGPRLPGLVALAHVTRPDAPRRPQLRDLFEEVVVNVPEEGKARGERIDVEPPGDAPLHVREAVGEGERQLLGRRGARFADVIARDRDRIPQRRMLRAPLEHVDDDLERRLDRIHPRVLGHVLLENVVLHRAAELRDRDALLFGGGDVETEQNGGRAIDRHGRRDLIERDPGEQGLHVGQRRDRHAALADFPLGAGMIGVVAHQGGKVERDGDAGLAMLEQEFVAAVRVGRAAEAGKLTHRPQLAVVHRRMNAARERILTRPPQLPLHVVAVEIGRRVDGLFLDGHLPFLTCSRTSAATSYGLRVPAATSSSRRASRSSACVASHTH